MQIAKPSAVVLSSLGLTTFVVLLWGDIGLVETERSYASGADMSRNSPSGGISWHLPIA